MEQLSMRMEEYEYRIPTAQCAAGTVGPSSGISGHGHLRAIHPSMRACHSMPQCHGSHQCQAAVRTQPRVPPLIEAHNVWRTPRPCIVHRGRKSEIRCVVRRTEYAE